MFTAYVVATLVAAGMNAYAGIADFLQPKWLVTNMARLEVPASWRIPLGAAKVAGALGLLVGLAVPAIGTAAAVGLMLFFAGAIVTVLRARWYAHYYPLVFFLAAATALALQLAE